MKDIGRILIFAGIALVLLGIIYTSAGRLGLGRLPGDFAFRRGNVGCYFPLMTSLILSILLTLVFWLFRR